MNFKDLVLRPTELTMEQVSKLRSLFVKADRLTDAEAMQRISDRFGITTKQIETLEQVAVETGIAFSTVAEAFGSMGRSMEAAAMSWKRPIYTDEDVQRRIRQAVDAERRRSQRVEHELLRTQNIQQSRIDRLVAQVIEAETEGMMTRAEANQAIESAIELERKQHPETTIVDGSHDRAFVVQPAKKEDE